MKKKHHNKDLSDISKDGWINIFIHPSIEPYFRLARFDRPIGTYLTMLPCLAALCQASKGVPSLYNLALFAIASLIMRSVGSIINDITDKKYDRHVERTRLRPLTNGDLTTYNAVIFLIILAIISFLLYFGLNESAQSAVLPIIPMMILYPFCKRFTNWP
ncbi:UbiA family prenyltransferase, partial [Vibrio harveyi]